MAAISEEEEFEFRLRAEREAEPTQATPKTDPYKQVAEDMSFGEQALAGAGGAMYGTYLGAKQLLGQASPEEVEEYKQASGALRDTGGGIVGEIGGNIATFALPGIGAVKAASKIAPIGLLGKSAGIAGMSAAGGAGQAALIPVGEGESRGGNMLLGGAVGAVAPAAVGAVIKGAQTFARPVRQLFSKSAIRDRAGRTMAESAGGYGSKEYEQVLENLYKKSDSLTRQSAGQAAAPAGSTGFSAMQKIADASKATPARVLADEQALGRSTALKQLSGDAPDLLGKRTPRYDLAVQSREKAANKVWGDAFAADDMRIAELQRRSANVTGGLGQRGAPIPIDPKVVPLQQNSAVMEASDYVAKNYPEFGGNPLASLRGLERIRKTLSDNLKNVSSGKEALLKNVDKGLLASAKDDVVKTMTALNPKVADALEDYAKRSVPVNQMEVARVLHDALSESMVAGEKKAVFENKIKAAAAIIKRSTGQDRYKKLSDLFSPAQMDVVKRTLGELSTDARLDELAKRGLSEQAKKLGIDEAKIPNMLNRATSITNSVFDKIFNVNKNRTLKEIAEIMNSDPKLAAYVMEKASMKEKNAIKAILAAQKATAGGTFLGMREAQQ